jgi:hypothetical protein
MSTSAGHDPGWVIVAAQREVTVSAEVTVEAYQSGARFGLGHSSAITHTPGIQVETECGRMEYDAKRKQP